MEPFQVHPRSLEWLLKTIHEGQLALPDFQRDFVWDPRATESLVESISREFPAGSLLFMPFREDTFKPRAIANAPALAGAPAHLILDGQQRLTSLYQAFFGVGESRYFVDLQALIEGADVEDAIFYRHHKRAGQFKTLDQQAAKLVLPLGVLFGDDARGFEGWLDDVLDLREEGERKELKSAIRKAHDRYIKTIEAYRFPVVSLDADTPLEAVCSIFETLNRTGVRLTVFELLAARFYAHDLNLRALWEKTLARFSLLEEFQVDPYYLLQSVALRARGSTKRGDVLSLTRTDIDAHWEHVARGYEEALLMLRNECGVLVPKWVPYNYMLVPLGACWRETVGVPGPAAGVNRHRIQRWFWCSAFSQTYESAANSQATRDYVELRRWLDGGEAPQPVAEFAFDPARLRDVTPRQQSVYRAAIALILRHGARDFHKAEPLTPTSIATYGVDDHHIFPQGYLADEGITTAVDSVLNRTLIDASTNRRIGKRSPSDYLAEMEQEFEAGGHPALLENLLASHLLPPQADSPLRRDAYEEFLSWRQAAMWRQIAELTGTPHVVEVGATLAESA